MLSDDDLLEPSAIELLVEPLQRGSHGFPPEEFGVVWCPCTIIDPAGRRCWVTDAGPETESSSSMILALCNGRRGPRFSSVLVRSEDALSAGGYDGRRYGDLCDAGNWMKIALSYRRVACVNQPLVQYRTHAASTTRTAACKQWQDWGNAMFADLRRKLTECGVRESVIRSTRRNMIANLTVTVLFPSIGQPGWVVQMIREVLRAWDVFLTPYVAQRLVKEFWKTVRFWRSGRHA